MLLRSGCIIPFQYRDMKKLIQIGEPEEDRELNIFDFKNVVRAAFGIYSFEFRNRKIDFNIPDDLLLHYLAQRRDLTNFVIEINPTHDDVAGKEAISFEASCSQKLNVPLPLKSNCSSMGSSSTQLYAAAAVAAAALANAKVSRESISGSASALSDHSSSQEPPHKLRISHLYSGEHTSESMRQCIDPLDIIPKAEQELDEPPDHRLNSLDAKYEARLLALQHHHQQQQQHHHHHQQLHAHTHAHQPPPLHQSQQQQLLPHFFGNYGHSILGGASPVSSPQDHQHQNQHQAPPFAAPMMNRFRRRGERMSKDQKELYVNYFDENPCMLTQRRNDAMLEPHWNKLALMLNNVQQGAVKNVEEWKQTFDAWRYRVFMYTRYNSKLTGPAAQNPKSYKPLTSTDQRAYAMWTSHKNTAPHDYDKIDMFPNMDESQVDFDY